MLIDPGYRERIPEGTKESDQADGKQRHTRFAFDGGCAAGLSLELPTLSSRSSDSSLTP